MNNALILVGLIAMSAKALRGVVAQLVKRQGGPQHVAQEPSQRLTVMRRWAPKR